VPQTKLNRQGTFIAGRVWFRIKLHW